MCSSVIQATFLDASTHLYKRARTSVGLSVGLLVGNRLFFTGRYSKEKMRRPPSFLWFHTFSESRTRECVCSVRCVGVRSALCRVRPMLSHGDSFIKSFYLTYINK